jgi:hypothetical protein
MRSMLVSNHRADTIMMTVPITKIIMSIVSQRGTRFAGLVMAWNLRDLHSPTRLSEKL